jgi:hypothetical protein
MGKFSDIVLTELGETENAYRWKETSPGERFEWETEGYRYILKIERHNPEELYVAYMIDPSDFDWSSGGTPFNAITNEGNQFRIVATAIDIVKYVWRNKEELYENPEVIEYISFDGSPKEGEVYSNKTSRDKLYVRFIKTQFPDARIESTMEGYRIYPANK